MLFRNIAQVISFASVLSIQLRLSLANSFEPVLPPLGLGSYNCCYNKDCQECETISVNNPQCEWEITLSVLDGTGGCTNTGLEPQAQVGRCCMVRTSVRKTKGALVSNVSYSLACPAVCWARRIIALIVASQHRALTTARHDNTHTSMPVSPATVSSGIVYG